LDFEKSFNATRSRLRTALDDHETDFESIRAGGVETCRQLRLGLCASSGSNRFTGG
jgi:hypothetical protein